MTTMTTSAGWGWTVRAAVAGTACVFLLLAAGSGGALAGPRPVETGTEKNLRGVAYGAGRFVAVGEVGTVLASEDGLRWGPVAPAAEEARRLAAEGDPPDLEAVIYAGGRFVAVGEGGAVLTLAGGRTWRGSRALEGYGGRLRALAYGRGLFVAGGSSATLLTSPDGLTWQRREPPVAGGFTVEGLAYGKGIFVAVGVRPAPQGGLVLTSPDGSAWTAEPSAAAELERNGRSTLLRGVAFGGGRFVAVAEDAALYSDDGATWRLAALSPQCRLRGVAHLGGFFAATGSCGDLYISRDGAAWQRLDGVAGGRLAGAAIGGCVMLAVGEGGTGLAMSLGLAEGGGVSDVEVDGVCLAFPDARPVITGGRTLVPVRALAERGFGYRVRWDPQRREVTITGLGPAGARRTVVLTVGARAARVDGRAVQLEVPAAIRQNRVYVPLRFVTEAFGAEVKWERELRVVRIRQALPD